MWLPADDYENGLKAWPELGDSDLINGPDGRLSHEQYCRELQRRLRDAAESGMSRMRIAPLRVAAFTTWCAENDEKPGRDSRAAYAAELARQRDPSIIAWPPGRNEPCWCGSGRKYKMCCAAPR